MRIFQAHYFDTKRLATLICGIVLTFSFVGCLGTTGSGAETQASLPAPVEEDSGVTISSPDGAYVVVTGRDAVPDNATVIANVSDGDSAILNVLSALMPAANAQSCQITIPTCPEISSDGECQFTADEEGNFTFQLPAELGDEITLSYLDSTSCQEVEFVEDIEVDSSTPVVDYIVQDAVLDPAGNYALMIGRQIALTDTGSSNVSLSVLDLNTREIATADFDQVSDPDSIDLISAANESTYVIISGALNIMAASVDDPAALVDGSADFLNFVYSNGEFVPLTGNFLSAATFSQTDDGSCTTFAGNSGNFTRLFFTDGPAIYFHEFGSDLTDATTDSLTTYEGETAIALRSWRVHVTGTNATYEIADIPFFAFGEDGNVHLAAWLDDGSDTEQLLYFKIDRETAFNSSICASYLDVNYDDGIVVQLSTDVLARDFDITLLSGQNDDGQLTEYLSVFSANDQEIKMVSPDTELGTIVYSFDPENSLLNITESDFSSGQPSTTMTSMTLDTLTEQIVEISYVYDANGEPQLFFLGEYFGGSAFINPDGGDSTIALDVMPSTLYPTDILYDSGNGQFVIFDIGLSSSYAEENASENIFTFVKFYSLDSE